MRMQDYPAASFWTAALVAALIAVLFRFWFFGLVAVVLAVYAMSRPQTR